MAKSSQENEQLQVVPVYDILNCGPRSRFVANGRIVSNCNLQNLPSRGDGANLRRALLAPKGTRFIIADAAQIEARMLSWRAAFRAKLEAFRAYDRGEGPDLYCVAAASIYGREIDAEEDPNERFVGKVLELAGGYGAGAPRLQRTFKLGQYGDPVDMPLQDVKAFLGRWRVFNAPIVQYWGAIEHAATVAFVHGVETEFGPLVFEKFNGNGYMHMPNGTYQKYPKIGFDASLGGLHYISRNGPVKLYGAVFTENEIQGLCCALLKQQMLWMTEQMEHIRICLLVHDETVCLCPEELAEEYAVITQRIISTPADWCEGIPLNAKTKVSTLYNKG